MLLYPRLPWAFLRFSSLVDASLSRIHVHASVGTYSGRASSTSLLPTPMRPGRDWLPSSNSPAPSPPMSPPFRLNCVPLTIVPSIGTWPGSAHESMRLALVYLMDACFSSHSMPPAAFFLRISPLKYRDSLMVLPLLPPV